MIFNCAHGRRNTTRSPCPYCLQTELARVTAERDELKRRIVDADVGVVENFHISDTRATLTLRRVGPLSQVSWVPFIGTHVGLLSLTDSERK